MKSLLDYEFDAFRCYEADPVTPQTRIDLEGLEWKWLQLADITAWPAFSIEFHGLTNTSWHRNFTMYDFNTSPQEKCAVLRRLAANHTLVAVEPNPHDCRAASGMPNVALFTYVSGRRGEPVRAMGELSFPPFVCVSPFAFTCDVKTAKEAEEELAKLQIAPLVRAMYHGGHYSVEDFIGRITQGQRQQLSGPVEHVLHTIGNGGDGTTCIVCCAPFAIRGDTSRRNAARGICESLRLVHYNGHYLELIGGYPLDWQHAGVPYAFKLFAILEAKRRGFTSVIWVDAAVRARRNPAPLFEELRKVGALLRCKWGRHDYDSMCLPLTLSLLNSLTQSTDGLHCAPYIETVVMGLQLSHPAVERMIAQYFTMVQLGWPFFSIFPEELVFTALFDQPGLRPLRENAFNKVLYARERDEPNSQVYFVQTEYAPQVTFEDNGGRLGNQLFCILFCELLHLLYGHQYVPWGDFCARGDVDVVMDNNASEYVNGRARGRTLILRGFFQTSAFYAPYRTALARAMERHLPPRPSTLNLLLKPQDVVVSLRLDDFVQSPCPTTDVIPPEYYLFLLAQEEFQNRRVVIVVDKIRHAWESTYIEHFRALKPVVMQNDAATDFHLLKESETLLHSNSTFCWMASFCSLSPKRRVIPFTPKEFMNQNQELKHIEPEDQVHSVYPLTHWRLQRLWPIARRVHPLPFSVPDECVVPTVPLKRRLLAPLVPGQLDTYIYTEEIAYHRMYQEARFALTRKKGGWDCLRHYEILMNGCIPLFEKLDECPRQTLITYPKELNAVAWELYYNWRADREPEYQALAARFLKHTREHCTTSAAVRYVLSICGPASRILLLPGFVGRNHYQRDSLWIGLCRALGVDAVDEGGECILTDPTVFTYAGRLPKRAPVKEPDIKLGLTARPRRWDRVIFGRAGPDENETFPWLEEVQRNYAPEEIVFLFGGDEPFSFCRIGSHENLFNQLIPYQRYAEELDYRAKQGICLVRELEFF